MKLCVSGIASKEGKKIAYVLFEEEGKSAEAVIPECRVIANNGFSEKEIGRLEEYLKEHLEELKQQALTINPLRALMKD